MRLYTLAAAAFAVVLPMAPASASAMDINLCTGGEDGPYHQAGEEIARMASGNPNLSVTVVFDTGGTWGNIQRVVQTDPTDPNFCHAMIGQPDGHAYLKRKNAGDAARLSKIQSLHREYLHVLCSTESGVDELEDLESDPEAYSIGLGDQGSGAWLAWQNIIVEDDDYAPVKPTQDKGIIGLSKVANNEVTCMLVPAGLGNKTVMDADQQYAGQLVLAEAQDSDFNDAEAPDGKKLYVWGTIPGDTYESSLQSGWGGSVDTISWDAGVYVNTEAFAGNEKSYEALIEAVNRARPAIIAQFGGE